MLHKFMIDVPHEEYTIKGKTVIVRREDMGYIPPLPPNGKLIALYEIVKRAAQQGYKEIMIFAKKQQGTSYAIGLPIFAQEFGLHPIIVCPLGKTELFPSWLKSSILDYDTETIRLHANMITINISQCRKLAQERGAYFVPFGLDDPLSIDAYANKFSLPDYRIGTLVTATMTGMILAGMLRYISRHQQTQRVDKVVGVSGGRPVESIYKSIEKYIPGIHGYGNQLEIINPYGRNFEAYKYPKYDFFPTHPDYEAKAWLWMIENVEALKEPIYFLNVGR